jgi:exodeoxyribonuclease VII small subunit
VPKKTGTHEDPEGPGEPAEAAPAFEDSIRRLSEIVEQLERGDLPLERSLDLFEEGVRLAKTSQARLDAAERRVEQLLGVDDDGKPIISKLDTERS